MLPRYAADCELHHTQGRYVLLLTTDASRQLQKYAPNGSLASFAVKLVCFGQVMDRCAQTRRQEGGQKLRMSQL